MEPKQYGDGWYLVDGAVFYGGPFPSRRAAIEARFALPGQHRFVIQAWTPSLNGGWTCESRDVAECDTAEAVGVALVQLTEDGEFFQHDSIRSEARKAAVFDRLEGRYVGGPPW